MKTAWFKIRNRFNFSPHPYEIGRPLIQSSTYADNYFCLKIYSIKETEYSNFYSFHLNYLLQNHPDEEETFFYHVSDIVTTRINFFKQQDPHSSKHAFHTEAISKLQTFQQFLRTIDQWNRNKPSEIILAEKDELILHLRTEIAALENKLEELRKYDSGEKIRIVDGGLTTLIDLVLQLQDLSLPDGRKPLRSQAQSPWYKLISKYFNHGENEIPINTARNYFPAQKDVKLIKGTEILPVDKLFQITPVKKKTS